MMAGGSKCPPPIFIFENNRKVIRLCTVLIFFFLGVSFEDRAIFHVSDCKYEYLKYVEFFIRKYREIFFFGWNQSFGRHRIFLGHNRIRIRSPTLHQP